MHTDTYALGCSYVYVWIDRWMDGWMDRYSSFFNLDFQAVTFECSPLFPAWLIIYSFPTGRWAYLWPLHGGKVWSGRGEPFLASEAALLLMGPHATGKATRLANSDWPWSLHGWTPFNSGLLQKTLQQAYFWTAWAHFRQRRLLTVPFVSGVCPWSWEILIVQGIS